MALQPAMRPEDGAAFYGNIVEVDGLFRASCWARTDNPPAFESPEYRMCRTQEDARRWIDGVAVQRGFKAVFWED